MVKIINDSSKIKYSIIVPVYNVEKYIEKCLESIVNQDYFSELCELILVDDGSTDNSGIICDNYANKYSIVKVIHKKNEGLLLARGAGIRESNGVYIINIDSDDYIENNYLKVVDAYINKYNPDFLNYGFIEDKDDKKKSKSVINEDSILIDKLGYLRLFISSSKYNSVCTKVIKSEILKRQYNSIYNFKTNMGEDKIQTINVLRCSNKICLIKECLYHYVMRTNSIVHNKSEKDLNDSIDVYDRVRSEIKKILASIELRDEEKRKIMFLYDSGVLDAMMEHIYKYNRRKDINISDKTYVLDKLSQRDFFLKRKKLKYQLRIYNKIRYEIFVLKKYNTLILIDKTLFVLQKIMKTAV